MSHYHRYEVLLLFTIMAVATAISEYRHITDDRARNTRSYSDMTIYGLFV